MKSPLSEESVKFGLYCFVLYERRRAFPPLSHGRPTPPRCLSPTLKRSKTESRRVFKRKRIIVDGTQG